MEPTENLKPAAPKEKPKFFDVVLAGPHEHRGERYDAGDELTLREDQVKRLEKRNLIKSKTPAKPKTDA